LFFSCFFFQFVVSDKAEIQTQENQQDEESEELISSDNFNTSNDNLLKYHGGPILDLPISLHYFWYGPWSPKDQEVIIATFVGENIDTSDWYRVTVCYTDSAGHTVTDSIDIASQYYMNQKLFGETIEQTQFAQIIQSGISKSGINNDPNDIYVLWLHDNIDAASLCNDTCGYHSYFNTSAGSIKYMVIGSGGGVMSCDACASNNGPWNSLTNQIINTFAHELIETVSNPIPWTGYYDPENRENGAKCANQFLRETSFRSDPVHQWNVVIGIEDPHWFLLQGNWDIVDQNCTLTPSKNCYLVGGQKPIYSSIHNPSSGMMINVNAYHFLVILIVTIVNILLF